MGVTFIAPAGTYTAPAKLIEKTITQNDTYNAADDNANGYSSVTVNVEGGGGGGDFSTAEVTFNKLTPAYGGGCYIEGLTAIDTEDNVLFWFTDPVDFDSVTIVLYKGHAYGMASGEDLAISGSATWDSETNDLDITGDCTITYTPALE